MEGLREACQGKGDDDTMVELDLRAGFLLSCECVTCFQIATVTINRHDSCCLNLPHPLHFFYCALALILTLITDLISIQRGIDHALDQEELSSES